MSKKKRLVHFRPKNISNPTGKGRRMKYKKPSGVSDKYYKENRK